MIPHLDPYAGGVLLPDVHARIVADLQGIADDAMIQPAWICRSMKGHVGAGVTDWVRSFRDHAAGSHTGLCVVGTANGSPEAQCSAIAGALIRNFIRARVFTAGQIVDLVEKHHAPEATCLLVPNLFSGKAAGSTMAAWKVNLLLDALLERHLRGQSTVVCVADIKTVGLEYGAGFRSLLDTHYVQVGG